MKRATIKILVCVPVTVTVDVEGDDDDLSILHVRDVSLPTVSGINENMTDDDHQHLRELFNDAVYGQPRGKRIQ